MANLTKQLDYSIAPLNYFLKIAIIIINIIIIIYIFFIKVTVNQVRLTSTLSKVD